MLNMQNVKDIEIPEGDVRTIHDKDDRLIWGRLAYDTKYAGDTYQQTYSGANLFNNKTMTNKTISGDVTIIDDNSFTMYDDGTGGGWKYVAFEVGGITPNTNYSMKFTQVDSKGTSTNTWINVRPTGGSAIVNQTYASGTQIHFNSGEGTTSFIIQFYAQAGGSVAANTADVSNVQLNVGSSTGAYEPYTGGIPAPNPDYPQDINVVTGEQTVTISDGVDSEDFNISLGSIELCKIGDYQDYIYKSGDDWYVHKALSKYVFSGNETINYQGSYRGFTISSSNLISYMPGIRTPLNGYSNYFTIETSTTTWTGEGKIGLSASGTFWAKSTAFGDTQQNCEAWLSTNTPTVYYALATANDTQITDATLVGQLDAIHEWLTRYGYSATVTGNLPIIINQTNL